LKTRFEHGEEKDTLVIEIEPDDEYSIERDGNKVHVIKFDYDVFSYAHDTAMMQKLNFMSNMKRGPDTERYYYVPNKRG